MNTITIQKKALNIYAVFNQRNFFYLIGTIISATLTLGAWQGWLPMQLTEVFGFITGAICVWLVVKDNIWNWPVGIINNIFYVSLFWGAQLYADMALQVVYIVLGGLGWYWWLKGGENKTELPIGNIKPTEIIALSAIGIACTYGMTLYLQSVNDSAPFLDALTTVMSLVAQYMLTKKYLENWYVWIAADVIYIGLYFYKGLALTAVLYGIFLTMCLIGLKAWEKKSINNPHLHE